ncbi:hypothetical protein BH20VER1_BH20VER1_18370 [soil metagenome]|jgi:serine/threonine protein kinase
MSPQQLDGERGTHLDDIYSLGATLYDLLTSKPPFYSGNLDKQIHERTAPGRASELLPARKMSCRQFKRDPYQAFVGR